MWFRGHEHRYYAPPPRSDMAVRRGLRRAAPDDADPNPSGDEVDLEQGEQERPLTFLEAVFSFLFGDGSPNEDFEMRRWHAIGSAIASNKGIIIAEQVEPYAADLVKSNGMHQSHLPRSYV